MKEITFVVLLVLNSSSLLAQTILTIEGTVVNNTELGFWSGVNIPKNIPTTLTYRNNSITSVNGSGYILQAGDDNLTDPGTFGNLNGSVITGNQFKWNGTCAGENSGLVHGCMVCNNINDVIKYNYYHNVPAGVVMKAHGTSYTTGGVAYNVFSKNGLVGINILGINNVPIYNNTFYSEQVYFVSNDLGVWRGIINIYNNDQNISPVWPSTGIKIKNNIFYTKHQIPNISVHDASCLSGFESDYNVFYCEAGTPVFEYLGVSKTFAQWKALGYDTHSVVVNPNFKDLISFIPNVRLDYGTDLGSTWQKGLSVDAVWGSTDPATSNQNDTWQVGARIYSSQRVPVTTITVTGVGGADQISTDNGSLQLSADVLPENATDKTVTWSIVNGTGEATISSEGLVRAIDNGTVIARATANDGSGVSGTLFITISNQIVSVTGIAVSGAGGATIISTNKGSLQLTAEVLPANASNKAVTWSLTYGTGEATISSSGQVTAIDNGTVTARATSTDGSGVFGNMVITISNQIIPVTNITVSGAGGATTITTDNGTLQLNKTVLPSNATDKTVTWAIFNRTGQATINAAGLVTALDNGTVTTMATANDGSGVYDTLVITNSNQIVPVTGITITGAGGSSVINSDGGSLQLSASILPANATNKSLTWSIINGTGVASINSSGLVTASGNGTVTARATATDGSAIYGTMVIAISSQIIPVASVTVTGAGGATTLNANNGTLQLSAAILPINATNKAVIWSIVTGGEFGSVSSSGLLSAFDNGSVTVRATANDGSGVFGNMNVTISKQFIQVTAINVSGAGGLTTISTDNGSLQLNAEILPSNATNKSVTWSVASGTGQASINSSGLLTAIANGTVTARASASDGSGVSGSLVVNISNQIVQVTNINVSGTGNTIIINSDNGTLQLIAVVLPGNATDKTVSWSIVNGTGHATIDATGLVTAIDNGTVTAIATANDGSGTSGSLVITINASLIQVTGVTVTGEGNATTITTNMGSLQLSESVTPLNATNNTVTWSLINGTGAGTIDATGLVTAIDNGTVIAKATANDGSGVFGTLVITISNQIIPVTAITVTGSGGATTIATDHGSLQLNAAVLPVTASDKTVTWSVINGTGQATVSATGLFTAVDNGTVTAKAAANDGSGIFGILIITISNQIIPITGINVSGALGITAITTENGLLQLIETVSPVNATNKTVTWSIINGTGQATINNSGIVTAVDNGIVTARATANDGSGVYGSLVITISNQVIPVSGITIFGADGASTISTDDGTLQLSATILPANATDKTVTWSLASGTGLASINSAGLITAINNGTITVSATANDGSGVSGTMVITLSNQVNPVVGINVTGTGGATIINSDNGTLQLIAEVLPANATNNSVTWSLVNGTGQAVINATGRVTAVDNGTVTARATAKDGSGVYGTFIITISNQVIPVTSISISGAGGANTITSDNGTLQLSEAVLPSNATDKSVTWSLVNGTGQAVINASGRITAIDNGTVTARATANDGSGIYGTMVITISNQIVPVTSITITGSGGATIITADNGSLQLTATVLPSNATNKSVTWTLVNVTGKASINSSGLVTAADNGTVTARATANDGSGVSSTLTITIFNQVTPITGIIVTGSGGASTVTTDNGTLQLSIAVVPSNATNKIVTWSLINGTGLATISSNGLVTAIDNGTVTARATATDGSGVYGNLIITISNQVGPVTSITITGAGGAATIITDNGTLQLSASILPVNATVKTVTWSFVNSTGTASINSSGLVTAVKNGTVTARAIANDGSGVFGTFNITITNQILPVSGVTITAVGGANTITTDKGTIQLNASVLPVDAMNKAVIWTIASGTGLAAINTSGLVKAKDNGTIIVNATAADGSGIYGTYVINISNQNISVTMINIRGASGLSSITTDDGSLQLIEEVLPENATVKSVTWSITNGIEYASVGPSGLVTAINNGIVTVRATANDGSGIFGIIDISVSGQVVPVSSITVTGTGNGRTITVNNGTLQLEAIVSPINATDKSVSWSIAKGSGLATINVEGLVTGIENGIITVMASANDGSGIKGSLDIPIAIEDTETVPVSVTRNEMKILLNRNFLGWRADLYNFQGGLVKTALVDGDSIVFNISSLPSGVYLVVLSKGSNIRVTKVMRP